MLRTTSKKFGTVVAVALMALTGCGTTTTNGLSTSTQGSDVTGGTQVTETATAQATQEQAQVLVGTFGQTITLADGIAITTTAKVRKAGEYAYGAVEGQIVEVTVTVKNTSGVTLNANSETYPTVTYGAQGVMAQTANDESTKVTGITQTILAGETQTAVHGYGIPTAELGSVRVEYVSYQSLAMQTIVVKGEVK